MEEDLPLSVMEVGYGRPIRNDSSSTSENGSQFGAEDGAVVSTGSRFSHSSPREGRGSSCSAQTAVMEEDNYQNLHAGGNENITVTAPARDNRFYERFDDITGISSGSFGRVMKGRETREDEHHAGSAEPQQKTYS